MVHHFGREKIQRLIVVFSVTFAYCVTTTVDYRFSEGIFSEESGFSEATNAGQFVIVM